MVECLGQGGNRLFRRGVSEDPGEGGVDHERPVVQRALEDPQLGILEQSPISLLALDGGLLGCSAPRHVDDVGEVPRG